MMVKIKQQPEFIEGRSYLVEVKRTSRSKTASLLVEEGAVIVVVSKTPPVDRIEKIVNDKHDWIIDKIAQHKVASPASSKQYVSSEAFPTLAETTA